MISGRALIGLALLIAAPAAAAPASRDSALDAAVRDLCHRDVALLGEADHGDGRTVEFKVALVRALVGRCHFNAVFFEASHYDFLEFSRRLRLRRPSSPDMISAAVGGMWRFDQEFRPLAPFLYAQARAGRLVLGGIDDQPGSAGAFYSNDAMPAELAAYLAPARAAECRVLLHRRIYSDYGPGGHYTPAERVRLQSCLADIGRAIAQSRTADPATRADLAEMVASFARAVDRDLGDWDVFPRERDRSMYLNFRWLAGRLPPHSRIIVWAATAHVAKTATMTHDYAGERNFGSYVHQAYGARAFALGFSALSGTHFWSRNEPNRALATAGPDSLEALALAGDARDIVYLGSARLAALGPLPGAPFQHTPLTARWDDPLDGIIIFRAEHAPRRTDLTPAPGPAARPNP